MVQDTGQIVVVVELVQALGKGYSGEDPPNLAFIQHMPQILIIDLGVHWYRHRRREQGAAGDDPLGPVRRKRQRVYAAS